MSNGSKDWMDEIFESYEKTGGLNDLQGKGKPIPEQSLQGDVFQSILKEANYLPPWVEQQQQIASMIIDAIKASDSGQGQLCDTLITTINNEIRQYNRACPPIMQRGLVSRETIRQKLALWTAET